MYLSICLNRNITKETVFLYTFNRWLFHFININKYKNQHQYAIPFSKTLQYFFFLSSIEFLYFFLCFFLFCDCAHIWLHMVYYVDVNIGSRLLWYKIRKFFIEWRFVHRLWSSGCRSRYQGPMGRLKFLKRPFCIIGEFFFHYHPPPPSNNNNNLSQQFSPINWLKHNLDCVEPFWVDSIWHSY